MLKEVIDIKVNAPGAQPQVFYGMNKENCKWATTLEQSRNKRPRKKNKVGVVGIGWDKQRCKYRVQIGVNGKNYFVGRFATLEQAKTARQESEQNYWR